MIAALCAGILLISTQVKINYLSNPGFEDGLAGWSVKGDAIVSDREPIRGKRSLVFGKGGGSVTQSYKVPREPILWIWAFFKGGKVRKEQPDCEFVLISPMAFDPGTPRKHFTFLI